MGKAEETYPFIPRRPIDYVKVARSRYRNPGSPIGEILTDLLRAKGWSLRDLERATREDPEEGYVTHQRMSRFIRGEVVPGTDVLNRMLRQFGYRAVQEVRIEPIGEISNNEGENENA